MCAKTSLDVSPYPPFYLNFANRRKGYLNVKIVVIILQYG